MPRARASASSMPTLGGADVAPVALEVMPGVRPVEDVPPPSSESDNFHDSFGNRHTE
jgi:hypothetical protein